MNARVDPPKIMLGFVLRQCTIALGHPPSANELATWSNNQADEHGDYCVFGRAITPAEAAVLLRHPGRPVTVRPGPRWPFRLTTTG